VFIVAVARSRSRDGPRGIPWLGEEPAASQAKFCPRSQWRVSYELADVSSEHAASIFRAEETILDWRRHCRVATLRFVTSPHGALLSDPRACRWAVPADSTGYCNWGVHKTPVACTHKFRYRCAPCCRWLIRRQLPLPTVKMAAPGEYVTVCYSKLQYVTVSCSMLQ
jgi:hypothetical protein